MLNILKVIGTIFCVINAVVFISFGVFFVVQRRYDFEDQPFPYDLLPIPNYLWRPEENSNVTLDRTWAQYEWARRLENSEFLKNAKPKRIVTFDKISLFYFTDGKVQCPFPSPTLAEKCLISTDTLIYGFDEDISRNDAIVGIRNWDIPRDDLQLPSSMLQFLYILESPYIARVADLSKNNALLVSYWSGSDIPTPYRKWIPKSVNTTGYNFQSSFTPKDNDPTRNFAKGKTRLAAMLVSNCDKVYNNRQGYVNELRKYITVDVYGKCGKPCPKNGYGLDDCFHHLKQNYKFYLAFENSNCRDYMTEKIFHNGFAFETIPVVLGAHPSDYAAAVPPHSYISVNDFASPAKLAEYLLHLDQNDSLYNEYFKWRDKGVLVHIWPHFFCRVCAMLFYADFYQPPVWKQNSTWKTANECLPSNVWYWK